MNIKDICLEYTTRRPSITRYGTGKKTQEKKHVKITQNCLGKKKHWKKNTTFFIHL